MPNNVYLASKPRYEILDGLRGVAALTVVGYHLFETYFGGGPDQPLNHGYLAVDFFFVLSGFVIGYAYDDRWDRMTLGGFFKRRIVRLHPMIIAGTIMAILLYYTSGCTAFHLVNDMPWWHMLLIALIGMTMFPLWPGMDVRGWQEFYPMNGPQWSLGWEYLANVLYATIIRHFNKVVLAIFVGLSALLTLNLALNIDVGGVLVARSYAKYSVVGGWSMTPDQLLIGITRLLYPFFAGLLLSRMKWLTSVKAGFWWTSLFIFVVLALPHIGEGQNILDGAYQAVAILVFFPLIVSMGAGSKVTGRSAKVCEWLGNLSYPLYITHYPFIYLQMSWAESHKNLPTSTHVFFAICMLVLAVFTAEAWLKLYDIPVREWLKEHWLHKAKPVTTKA